MSTARWEYNSLSIDVALGFFRKAGSIDEKKLVEELDRLGEEGWELVVGFDTNASGGRSAQAVLLFKRPR